MKIIFLNAWGGKMGKELRGFFKLHAPDTDIFCLQEATDHLRGLVREYLQDFNKTAYAYQYESAVEFDLATYVRKAFSVPHSEVLFNDGERMSGLGICTELTYREKTLHILNYWGIAWPGKLDTPERIRQSEKILAYYRAKQGPKILGGDFNVLPQTRSIRMFRENGYRELVQDFAIPTTRNHLTWDRFPTKLLFSDYVFLSNDIEVIDFKVPDIEISDHLPLILQFDLKPHLFT